MLEKPSRVQIKGLLDALPCDLIFVDEEDRLRYWNKAETRSMKPPMEALGRDIPNCHKPESLPKLEKILAGFKEGHADEAEFWVTDLNEKVLNRFIAVRDQSGKYLGILEYLLDFSAMEALAREKKDTHKR